ncbi:hypothetical protein MYP_5018 [Sporocytophaga myxococcoides]|uniref:Uncharacterized protein n=1 Tax=Sporocytophaga myxococcoides TaxID=153721 RepID=A0A098LN89_9BACT|nr:hypothetical protein [Sporocytophaga myxococcoides]GAL87787.1 hypothetical protein MYP_5018 [Sporocytophaga myxococcoides]
MGIHIQKIQTNWTKESRSSPGSTLRNRVPEKLPIETEELSDSVVLQEIIYNEGRFNEPSKKKVLTINEVQIREQRLDFNYSDDSLEIGFWTEDKIRKKVGILNFNSWCQIKTNRRFPMEYTWGYYKIIYNIFYGDLNKAKDFMETKKQEIEMDFQSLLK